VKSGAALVLACISLAVALAIVVGTRLSDQAIAAFAGAACGVGLAGPVGFMLGLLVGANRHRPQPIHTPSPPQVIVVPAQPAPHTPAYMPSPNPSLSSPRTFTIIGEGDVQE